MKLTLKLVLCISFFAITGSVFAIKKVPTVDNDLICEDRFSDERESQTQAFVGKDLSGDEDIPMPVLDEKKKCVKHSKVVSQEVCFYDVVQKLSGLKEGSNYVEANCKILKNVSIELNAFCEKNCRNKKRWRELYCLFKKAVEQLDLNYDDLVMLHRMSLDVKCSNELYLRPSWLWAWCLNDFLRSIISSEKTTIYFSERKELKTLSDGEFRRAWLTDDINKKDELV